MPKKNIFAQTQFPGKNTKQIQTTFTIMRSTKIMDFSNRIITFSLLICNSKRKLVKERYPKQETGGIEIQQIHKMRKSKRMGIKKTFTATATLGDSTVKDIKKWKPPDERNK